MVVYNLDVRRALCRPNEAHPKLVVDPDRVLPLAIAGQCLKTVARRRSQIAEVAGGVEVAQFPTRHLNKVGRKAFGTLAIEDGLSSLVPEVSNHMRRVSFNDTEVNVNVSFNDTELPPRLGAAVWGAAARERSLVRVVARSGVDSASGAPDAIRTCGLHLRRVAQYPAAYA